MSKNAQIMSEIAHKVADLMTKHGTDWVKPWQGKGGAAVGLPLNIDTGNRYRGINTFLLMSEGFASRHWGTFKQWSAKGYKIKKGSKSTLIVFWKPLEKTVTREDGSEDVDKFWMLKTYRVFNGEQIEGWEEPRVTVTEVTNNPNTFQDCPSIEEFLAACGVVVNHGGDRAYYAPSVDAVQMPHKASFIGTKTSTPTEAYYSTLAHEATHWTGHASRLDRLKAKRFGDKNYAFEELVAELGAVFLSVQFGISPAPRPDHAAYLNNWIAALKADPKVLFSAASEAQKAIDLMENLAGTEITLAA
ncbi:MarR family transcriptional regulator [Roseobacter phage CRP-804]|uniref:MarR family transcriptional regulator n=1 Tax=Roseobacter phage CRP-804 TaxID=3072850 RepID=A0AAX3ZV48_9CAUD|nr:MarR family transcriptional regulator [Roseobacter phage CRP-804]